MKITIFISSLFLCITKIIAVDLAPDYEGTFTLSIYSGGGLSDEERLEEVDRRKKLAVESKFYPAIIDEIRRLTESREARVTNSAGVAFIAGIGTFFYPPLASTALTKGGEALAPQAEDQRISRLKARKLALFVGTKTEHCATVEGKYVKMKHLLPLDRQETIEGVLIATRSRGGYPNFDALGFIDETLDLPLSVKSLPPNYQAGNDYPLALRDFLTQSFDQDDSPFRLYDPRFKNELRHVISSICRTSQNALDPNIDNNSPQVFLRNLFLLQGKPGCGKSHAAQEVAKILGLPYYVFHPGPSDVARSELFGTNRYYPSAKKGKFTLPFFKTDAGGKSWLNVLLVIDEAELLFAGPGLKMMLDFFDPAKKSFYSDYFGCEINTAHLSILCTVNELPGGGPTSTSEVSRAFYDRVKVINVPDLPRASKIVLLEKYISENNLFSLSPVDFAEGADNRLLDFVMTHFLDQSIRKITGKASALSIFPEAEWEERAELPKIVEVIEETKMQKIKKYLPTLEIIQQYQTIISVSIVSFVYIILKLLLI